MNSTPFFAPQGMKWHKFQIYFSTWANAVCNILLGIMAFSAVTNPVGRYRYDESLVFMSATLGIALIALGIYFIFTRYALANNKSGAPNHLLAASLLTSLVVTLFMMLDMSANFSSIIPTLPVPLLTRWYYSKREYLFYL